MKPEERRYKVVLETLDKNPLRIGGKRNPLSSFENPMTKIGDMICIPGASLKGAYRGNLERYLIGENEKNNRNGDEVKPCIPSTELSSDEKALVLAGKYRDKDGVCQYPDKRKSPQCICPVCYFLGAAGLNGFIRAVPFLFADVSTTTELYSLAIDRATGTNRQTKKGGGNRPYEVVPPNTKFVGEIIILVEDPICGWQLGNPRPLKEDRTLGDAWLKDKTIDPDKLIKEYVIDRLESIEWLGGYKSKGCGRVKITVEGPIK